MWMPLQNGQKLCALAKYEEWNGVMTSQNTQNITAPTKGHKASNIYIRQNQQCNLSLPLLNVSNETAYIH